MKDDRTDIHSYAYDFRNLMTNYDGPGADHYNENMNRLRDIMPVRLVRADGRID